MNLQFTAWVRREGIHHPVRLPLGVHKAMLLQIIQVLGDFDLRLIQNLLEVADAERTTCQQVDDPQPCSFAKAGVNLD